MKELSQKKIVCILIASAFLLLLFCSQCSPLFPLNIWDDANCLLTVGRMMKHGAVLYRDVYEQKGPTLYLLHWIAACISESGFLGVYLLEGCALSAVMVLAYRMMARRLSSFKAFFGTVLVAALLVSSPAFASGDSAEEFCLPFIMASLYMMDEKELTTRSIWLCGLAAGFVGTIKYTILGIWLGICLAVAAATWQKGGIPKLLHSAGTFLAGMMIPFLLWTVYFLYHDALGDAFIAYIVNNTLHYAGAIRMSVADTLRLFRDNAWWGIFAAGGLAAMLASREEPLTLRIAVISGAVIQLAVLLFTGRMWPYTLLILTPFTFIGLMEGMALLDRHAAWKGKALLLPAAASVVCIAAVLLTPNAFLRFVPLEETVQGRLAAAMTKGSSLLQYSHLDDGLYLVSGALPKNRFFCRLNVAYDEMTEELDRMVADAEPDYVLVTWRELPEQFTGYDLILKDVGYDDDHRLNKLFYLYRRK